MAACPRFKTHWKKIIFALIVLQIFIAMQWFQYDRLMMLASAETRLDDYSSLRNKIELTVRIPLSVHKIMKLFFCKVLRSSSIFWDSSLMDGNYLLIVDEGDRELSQNLTKALARANVPLPFRFHFERPSIGMKDFAKIGKKTGLQPGYVSQLYSSFLMDRYTNKSIIGWIDTDVTFTMPVLVEDIFSEDGKLIIKGMNTLHQYSWSRSWEKMTLGVLGLPAVSDFMTSFPTFVYASTIKNCREFIISHLKVNSFDEAFLKFAPHGFFSPVIIIYSYAYYFERDLYEWHLDIGRHVTLDDYNHRMPLNHMLLEKDISPQTHVSIHSKYYHNNVLPPLERAICFAEIALGRYQVKPHCQKFVGKSNMLAFEFQTSPTEQNHYHTWCYREENLKKCEQKIKSIYNLFKMECDLGIRKFDTNILKKIEHMALKDYGIKCPPIKI